MIHKAAECVNSVAVNRTLMELKFNIVTKYDSMNDPVNRTLMELKCWGAVFCRPA